MGVSIPLEDRSKTDKNHLKHEYTRTYSNTDKHYTIISKDKQNSVLCKIV